MNCIVCNLNKISPIIPPFGFYLCENNHIQCENCNITNAGICAICRKSVNFVHLKLSPIPMNYGSVDESCTIGATTQPSYQSVKHVGVNEIKTLSQLNMMNKLMHDGRSLTTPMGIPRQSSSEYTLYNVPDRINHIEKTSELHNEYPNDHDIVETSEVRFMNLADNLKTLRISDPSRPSAMACNNNNDHHIDGLSSSTKNSSLDEPEQVNQHLSREPLNLKGSNNLYYISRNQKIKYYLLSLKQSSEQYIPIYRCYKCDCVCNTTEDIPINLINVSTGSRKLDYPENIEASDFENPIETLQNKTKPKRQQQQQPYQHNMNMVEGATAGAAASKKKDMIWRSASNDAKNVNQEEEKEQEEYKALVNHPIPQYRMHMSDLFSSRKDSLPPQYEETSYAYIDEPMPKNLSALPANVLNIPRVPITCPESKCNRVCFVSDFCKHVILDHPFTPIATLEPFKQKTFYLDPRASTYGTTSCHIVYMMSGRVRNFGNSKYKNFLPLLLMTSRINLTEQSSYYKEQNKQQDKTKAMMKTKRQTREHNDNVTNGNKSNESNEFLVIWMTGIAPEDYPISITLTVWTNTEPKYNYHLSYSGNLYSVQNSQKPMDVITSGHAIMLTQMQIDILTKNGENHLYLELLAH